VQINTRDTLGRRFRDVTQSTGKNIEREQTDLDWFEMIHRIGHQTSSALYERTKADRRNRTWALFRMRDLRHENKSEYGGPTFFFPPRQTYAHRADRNLIVNDITERAERALEAADRFYRNTPTTNNQQWKHDFMGSTITASIYLAVLQSPSYKFIFQDEIIARIKQRSFQFPYLFKAKDGSSIPKQAKLKPDGFFGIRYPNGEERIFIREEDCATEPNRSGKMDIKNHHDNIQQYTELLREGNRRSAIFGDARVVVLNTFSNPEKMRNVMNLVMELSQGRGSNYQCYHAWPAFGDFFRPPHPDLSLFGEWGRAGNVPLDIRKI
jgi:hypothetical protein